MRSSSPKPYQLAAGLTALPFLSLPALAQQPTALPAITVQGATLEAPPPRAPAPAPAQAAPQAQEPVQWPAGDAVAGEPAYTIGNAVSVVTGDELRAQQVRTAVEALRSLPGVSVSRSGGIGNLTQVRIRGAEGNHTLVLIDGIEANNIADGEFDFSNLSAEDIERIEVIRGPMSGLYGSNAVGGVINIITRQGRGPPGRDGAHPRSAPWAPATCPCARPAAARTPTSPSPITGATPAGSTSRRSAARATAPASARFTMRGGAKLLPGVTLDFTVRHTEKAADRDGFGDPTALAGLATAYDDQIDPHEPRVPRRR